jgi:hypothetical protein
MLLFASRCALVSHRRISTQTVMIYIIDGSKYCGNNECNTTISGLSWNNHCSSGANSPSDVMVTVNINGGFNLVAVNPIIESFSRNIVPEYHHGIESSMVYSEPPISAESLPGPSSRSLSCLLFHWHVEEIIPTFLMSNIYVRLCLDKALTLKQLRSYKCSLTY